MQGVLDLLSKLFPLEDRKDFAALMLWVLVLLSIAGAHGMMPFHPGFALSTQTEDTNRKVIRIEIRMLEKEIFEGRQMQCQASTERSKSFYRERLQDLLREYYAITNSSYTLPTCEELVQ
jgi:hypothetical protein